MFHYYKGTSGNLQLNFTFRRTLSVSEGEANPKGEPAVLVITILIVATYLVWTLQELYGVFYVYCII